MISIIDPNNRDYDFCHNRTALLGSYHYVKEGWGADAPKTAGVVVQARYTERRGAGF